MQEKIKSLQNEIDSFVAKSAAELEEYRIKWLSKKGEITILFDDFKTVAPEFGEYPAKQPGQCNISQQATDDIRDHIII